jgi:hypothetical protein
MFFLVYISCILSKPEFLEVAVYPEYSILTLNNITYSLDLNLTSPGQYTNVENLFPLGLISPNAFLSLAEQLLPLSFTHLILYHPDTKPEVLTRLRAQDLPNFSVSGRISESTRFFTSTNDCLGLEPVCAQLKSVCDQYGATVETCLSALDVCMQFGHADVTSCALNQAFSHIGFEQAYGTATRFVSIEDETPGVVVGRDLVEFLVGNAGDLNKKFPTLGMSLGQWLAPVDGVKWIDLF